MTPGGEVSVEEMVLWRTLCGQTLASQNLEQIPTVVSSHLSGVSVRPRGVSGRMPVILGAPGGVKGDHWEDLTGVRRDRSTLVRGQKDKHALFSFFRLLYSKGTWYKFRAIAYPSGVFCFLIF